MGVIAEGIPRGCQGLFTRAPVSLDTHYQFSIKTLLSRKKERKKIKKERQVNLTMTCMCEYIKIQ
jgi:hypothetical protein